jgi:hypothetical protein
MLAKSERMMATAASRILSYSTSTWLAGINSVLIVCSSWMAASSDANCFWTLRNSCSARLLSTLKPSWRAMVAAALKPFWNGALIDVMAPPNVEDGRLESSECRVESEGGFFGSARTLSLTIRTEPDVVVS